MTIKITTIEKLCRDVSNRIQEEFPNLTIIYIPHNTGERHQAFELKKLEIKRHPAGAKMLPDIEKISLLKNKNFSLFTGLGASTLPKYLRLFRKQQFLACFFINMSTLKSEEYTLQTALMLAWHALSLMTAYEKEEAEKYTVDNTIIKPVYNAETRAFTNMLGDIFAALYLELSGRKGSIHKLAKNRGMMTLNATPGYEAEYYPYPVAFDTAQIVYKDFYDPGLPKARALQRAIMLTHETYETLDETAVQYWQAFSKPAQEMAWMHIDKNRILGAAVYTSEDPFVQTTAYAVADSTHIQPAITNDLNEFNLFADPDSFERNYQKQCLAVFEKTLAKAEQNNEMLTFKSEALRQNKQLMSGHIKYWCGHALVAAQKTYDQDGAEKARAEFEKACMDTPYNSLRKVYSFIIGKLRKEEDVNIQNLADFIIGQKDLIHFRPAFFTPEKKPPE